MQDQAVAYAPGRLGGLSGTGPAVRAVGILRSKIDSLNRLSNMISEDMAGVASEIDHISGCTPTDPNKSAGERPVSSDLDHFQEQLDRLDRLAQFVHGQLDRLRAI